jgi:hypothetical protein
MKKFLFLVFITFLSVNFIFSQRDTIKYSVVKDNPDDVPNMYISINPAVFNAGMDMYGGFDVKLDYTIADKFNIRGGFEMQYPKLNFTKNMIGADANSKITNNMTIDLGLGYVFSDKTRTEDATVIISSHKTSGYNVTVVTNNVIQAKMEQRRILRVRLGGFYNVSNFSLPKNTYATDGTIFNVDNGSFFDNNKVAFSDIDYKNLLEEEGSTRFNERLASDINGKVITKSTLPVVYLGISISKINNQVLDVKDHGLRGNAKYSTFYFDVMFGSPKIHPFEFYKSNPLATVYGDEVSTELKEYEIDIEASDLKPIPVGFRIGYSMHLPFFSKTSPSYEDKLKQIERPVYLTYYLEAGLKPCVDIIQGVYLKAGVGIDINPF